MIWHLLWLYPLIGLGLGVYYTYKFWKHGHGSEADLLLVFMPFIWPLLWTPCAQDVRRFGSEQTKREDKEYEALLESIRRERYAPDPRLAEFDKELGIEPGHNEDPELWIPPRKGLSDRERYNTNMKISRSRNEGYLKGHYTDAEGVMYRVRDVKPPTTAELTYREQELNFFEV